MLSRHAAQLIHPAPKLLINNNFNLLYFFPPFLHRNSNFDLDELSLPSTYFNYQSKYKIPSHIKVLG